MAASDSYWCWPVIQSRGNSSQVSSLFSLICCAVHINTVAVLIISDCSLEINTLFGGNSDTDKSVRLARL